MLEIVWEALKELKPDRVTDFVEIFGGVAMVTRRSRRKGLRGWAFDIKYSGSQNFLTIKGLLNISWHAKEVKPGGLATMAPQCSSWPRNS